MKHYIIFSLFVTTLFLTNANAQIKERTIDEIKTESIDRAKRGAYPLGGLDVKDVEQALSLIQSRDRDEWANGWGKVAQSYMDQASQARSIKEAAAAYKKAWRLYYFAQWPVPNSAGKPAAYDKAIDAYLKYAQSMGPPMEVVKIPFEGKTITGYLRFPSQAAGKSPMVLAISGLDSRKETVADSYEQILSHGIGFLAVDGPGTGQAPSDDTTKISKDGLRYKSKEGESPFGGSSSIGTMSFYKCGTHKPRALRFDPLATRG